jgi:methyl-accepting chemotaxis protein
MFAFVPFIILAVASIYLQIATLNSVNEDISEIAEVAIIDIEKKRLVTVIDSAMSIISPYLKKPGKEGMEEALALLYSYRFEQDTGYLFSYDTEGNRLMSGSDKGVGGNFIDLKDKLGNFIVRNILKSAKSEDGFTTYYFPKKGETTPSAKYSYAAYIEKWDIVIATGFFIDGTEQVLANIELALDETVYSSL